MSAQSIEKKVFRNGKFREYRKAAKLTLQEIGDALGVSKASVHAWELARCEPSPRNFAKICQLLGVDPDDLQKRSGFLVQHRIAAIEAEITSELTISLPSSVVQIIKECFALSKACEDNYESFIIDCIYRRWHELKALPQLNHRPNLP